MLSYLPEMRKSGLLSLFSLLVHVKERFNHMCQELFRNKRTWAADESSTVTCCLLPWLLHEE